MSRNPHVDVFQVVAFDGQRDELDAVIHQSAVEGGERFAAPFPPARHDDVGARFHASASSMVFSISNSFSWFPKISISSRWPRCSCFKISPTRPAARSLPSSMIPIDVQKSAISVRMWLDIRI